VVEEQLLMGHIHRQRVAARMLLRPRYLFTCKASLLKWYSRFLFTHIYSQTLSSSSKVKPDNDNDDDDDLEILLKDLEEEEAGFLSNQCIRW
jgi:hypothetical protein